MMAPDRANNHAPPGVEIPPREQAFEQDARDIACFLEGNSCGFEALMNRYRQQAYTIALGLTGNHDDAMDAVQKAFIRIYRALPRFQAGAAFFPWLYRIVRNAALNQRRDEGRHRGQVPLEWVRAADGRPSPLEQTVAADFRARLWDGIQALPSDQREVFVLYHFQGLKYREIAAALQIPLGTVMSRLHGARLQLRQLLFREEAS